MHDIVIDMHCMHIRIHSSILLYWYYYNNSYYYGIGHNQVLNKGMYSWLPMLPLLLRMTDHATLSKLRKKIIGISLEWFDKIIN